MRLSQIAGPPIGGLAMGLGGVAAAFTVAGLFFALSLPLLLTLRIRMGAVGGRTEEQSAPGTARKDLIDGLRYIRRHRLIGPLVAAGAICELGLTGILGVGMVLLNAERGWGPSGYGWIVSGFGAGAATSAALLAMAGWLRYPLIGAAMGAWGAAPVFAGCGAFAGLGGIVVLASDPVRRAELPRQQRTGLAV